ncbi:MAG TPA: cytochrome-c oxidase, cbb3-type subunit I [Luteolibacter sp.]|nr:cytochrome-c oxidase, cbb3-type subunit I [Luteolibacter sp.]
MTTQITYDDKTVRHFMIASIFWGIVGMLVGVIIATQLSSWEMNGRFWGLLETLSGGAFKADGVSFLTFGRLRPLHTNAVIFAFVGNMMFAGVYYSTQRLCKCRMGHDCLSRIHFWGWQLIIVAAALTLPAGLTRGKEYAELIWPINIAVVLIWVVFAVNFFWTLIKRNEPSLYVALWFYISTVVTVAMLYIVNHLSLPTSLTHSYPIFAGLQDGLVQWWYGHNAVAFFLTTPILGIMYYFLPKAANRPVYSYRLSIVHFWSLVFLYIWAGPHHLLNTALPRWLQLLGMLFSLMLWAPSWGGMLNGLLTLRGAWDKLRTDPVIKFLAAGVTFYGMATFEGPLLSITKVNALSHYTDWTIGHVHSGALGWNGFMAAGMFYWLAPRLWKTQLWSKALANMHFWIGTIGILIYVAAMWAAGIMQGLMLNEVAPGGTTLKYEFIDTLESIQVFYALRSFGGLLFLLGFVLLAVNIWKTARSGAAADESVQITLPEKSTKDRMRFGEGLLGDPVTHMVLALAFAILGLLLPPHADKAAWIVAALLSIHSWRTFNKNKQLWTRWHERLIENYLPFTVLVFVAVAIGGSVQIIPTLVVNRSKNVEGRLQELYTPLELAGRDIYVAEGCYNCHSQMVRTLVPEVMRYGRPGVTDDYSHLGESIYDHPYQWGSKRTGPDLAREGGPLTKDAKFMRIGKRGNDWHFNHFINPRQISGEASNMPSYPWLLDQATDIKSLPTKISQQVKLGVPWPVMEAEEIRGTARIQAVEIATNLIQQKVTFPSDAQLGIDREALAKEFANEKPEVAQQKIEQVVTAKTYAFLGIDADKLRKEGSTDEQIRTLAQSAMTQKLAETKMIALIAYVQKIGSYKTIEKPHPTGPRTLDPDSHRSTSN